MAKSFEFHFDFGSPASYLAWTQLPELQADTGAQADCRPMLLRGATGLLMRGVFGAPTFFVGETMFWGQDRIDWVREALA